MPEIERYLQGKSLDNVEFVGGQPQPRSKELMSRSHVMVLPSIEEGLALVQGEAMACGCPVIALGKHRRRRICSTTGTRALSCPSATRDAITERLEQLAQDPALRDAMSARALERVARIGGWDTYGRDYVAVLEALTTGRGGRRWHERGDD